MRPNGKSTATDAAAVRRRSRAMRASTVVAVIVGALGSGALLVGAIADQPSAWSREVPGPAIGPAGQSGPIRYMENPGTPYSGGAVMHGPYRLLPPGTLPIERTYPGDSGSRDFSETRDRRVIDSSALKIVAPPAGYVARSTRALLRSGQVIGLDEVWEALGGNTVIVSAGTAPEWRLPLDVYLYMPDSLLEVLPITIAGRPAIVEQPRAGPAANVGHVRIWIDGIDVALSSPTLDQTKLVALAESMARKGETK